MAQNIQLQTGELFSGAGGLGLGFVLAAHTEVQFRPLFAVDSDAGSLASYLTNMFWLSTNAPDMLQQVPYVMCRDISKLSVAALMRLLKLQQRGVDLLLGGPPCQGFSTSNRQSSKQRKKDHNRLVKTFLDRLEESSPKMFLLENVQGLRWTEPTDDMQGAVAQPELLPVLSDEITIQRKPTSVQSYLIDRARQIGYRVWYGVVDAAEFGVPQHRYRFFLFGVLESLLAKNEDVNLIPYLKSLHTERRVSVREAIEDLPPLTNGEEWKDGEYKSGESKYVSIVRQLMRNAELYDHFTAKHADYVIERFKRIPAGGNWESIRDLLTNYAQVDNTHSNIYRRLDPDKPAGTISHYRKSMTIHPTQHRGISQREACRLQGFPDWFRFQGGAEEQRQQLANAVPPLMSAAIANAIASWWIAHLALHSAPPIPRRIEVNATRAASGCE